MNRAQRRAAAKPTKTINKSAAWMHIQKKLYSNSHDDLQQDDITELLTRNYATIERLAKTEIDDADFININEGVIAAFCLGSELHQALADDGAKQQIAASQKPIEDAADALANIGERKSKVGKYRATGDELLAIREALAWYSEMLPIANRGIVLRALMRAEQMVTSKLRSVANAKTA